MIFKTGNGDCVSGCTEWNTSVYKIAANGTVESFTSIIQKSNPTNIFVSNKYNYGSQSVFSLHGRRVENETKISSIGKGFYLTPANDKQDKKIFIIK
jgi:hypothetical protein